MSRSSVGETIEIKPGNDIYTALAGIAVLAVIIALVVLMSGASDVLGSPGLGLF